MAWSDRAREAAKEARRRKAKQKVVVKDVYGKKFRVTRDVYASKLRRARSMSREFRKPGEKKHGRDWNKNVVRPNAGAYAAHHAEMGGRKSTGREKRNRARSLAIYRQNRSY